MNSRIQAIIDSLGIKKVDFAKRLNLSQPFISELCSGKNTPSDRTISDICREFNVSEAWLRTGEGEMFLPRSRDDQIASFVGDVMRDQDPDFRRRFIAALTKFSPEDWDALEKMLHIFSEKMDKEEKGQ